MKTSSSRSTVKTIAILGAGFGGLRTALSLAQSLHKLRLDQQFRVVLIDRLSHHTFTPLLYEIATTSKELADYCELKSLVTYPLSELTKKLPITILQEELQTMDCEKKILYFQKSKLSFAYCVIALGAETNFFNIPELHEYALQFKTFDHAIAIRNAVTFALENGKGIVNIVIGGGGSTGVELASEIKSWAEELKIYSSTTTLRVTIIEGTKTVLANFDPRIIKKTTARLKSLGVECILGSPITHVQQNIVTLQNGTMIPFQVLVWTGGIQASSLTTTLPIKSEKRDRIETTQNMECLTTQEDLSTFKKIYAIGDVTCFYDPRTGKPVPQVAHTAITQGKIVAHNIVMRIREEEGLMKNATIKKYSPITYPYIIPVGGKYAVAKIGPFVFAGLLAWIFKGIVELRYFLTIMPTMYAIRVWLKGLKIFIQNDRLG